jgi:hypothetical protein
VLLVDSPAAVGLVDVVEELSHQLAALPAHKKKPFFVISFPYFRATNCIFGKRMTILFILLLLVTI